jgi:hypothetical protein
LLFRSVFMVAPFSEIKPQGCLSFHPTCGAFLPSSLSYSLLVEAGVPGQFTLACLHPSQQGV